MKWKWGRAANKFNWKILTEIRLNFSSLLNRPNSNRHLNPGGAETRYCGPRGRSQGNERQRNSAHTRVLIPLTNRVSVRQISALLTASFRFHLAMDALALRLAVPLAGPALDFNQQV